MLATGSLLTVVSAVFALQAFLNLRQLWLLYALAAVQAGVQLPPRDPLPRTG